MRTCPVLSPRHSRTSAVIRSFNPLRRHLMIAMALLTCAFTPAVFAQRAGASGQAGSGDPNPYRLRINAVRNIDGSNGSTMSGQTHLQLLRKAPAAYPGDGSGDTIVEDPTRPNPRTISNAIVAQGSQSSLNSRGMSDYVWAWGQFLDHDLDLSESGDPLDRADISIDDPTDILGPNPLPFTRSFFDLTTGTAGIPRQQTNVLTAFIDASNVYGSDSDRAAALRTFSGGMLKTSAGNLLPFNVDNFPNGGVGPEGFFAGDIRSNENVVLTSLHTLFVREHNRIAHLAAIMDPLADDERLYQFTRKIVGAEIQAITLREFLPALMGPDAPTQATASRFRQADPRIANEFSTAFFRLGHSLLSSNLQRAVDGVPVGSIPLQDAFFRPDLIVADAGLVDELLAGLVTQRAQELDNQIVDDVRNFLFGPAGAGGLDLAALNIQRGRDHGLPDYNTLRAAYGLSRVRNFNQITSSNSLSQALQQVYGNVDNIDPWIGALAEDHRRNSSLGPLITAALQDQFNRVLGADQFNALSDGDLRQQAASAVFSLNQLKLSDVVRNNTTVTTLPTNVFFTGQMIKSDVSAKFDEQSNWLHINGNANANQISLTETPLGILVTGLSGTKINGNSSQLFLTGDRPNICIDLGAGDDSVVAMGVSLGDVLLSLGDGHDTFSATLSSARRLMTDEPLPTARLLVGN